MALEVEYLDNLRLHKKRRRYACVTPSSIAALPAEWREMLVQWLNFGGNTRWETLLKKAGVAHKNTAESLLEWLLNHGWAVVDEVRQHGGWWPYRVELRAKTELRQMLGLPDAAEIAQQWQQLRSRLQIIAETRPALLDVIVALDAMPVSRVSARACLVLALLDWQAQVRSGSYRDFALYARGDTKAVSANEWAWLTQFFDLADYGISSHTPLFYLSANFCLHSATGHMDLSQMQPFVALPPGILTRFSSMSSETRLRMWICVENLTSFERLAAQRAADTAIIWIPGFPPAWWLEGVSALLHLCPAPLQVACDPDPAGVRIALKAIQHWQAHHLEANAWRMGVEQIQNCEHRKPLNAYDQEQLTSLLNHIADLPQSLADLVNYMVRFQQKAEQEAYL